ncbi:recombinase family protein [Streptomyces sp. NPDC047718]|uniref:recombinase family protein n=1 Tax=Streptomyces sp. NPDC047718 TaxID=3155479 RepID=UPI0033CC1E6F
MCDPYLRRSTLQDNKDTLKAHERDLRERAQREGLTVREVWTDEASAFKAGVTREKFDKAIASVVAGEVRHLLVWKLDRLSRRGMPQVGDVLDTFESRNARLVAHMDGLDGLDEAPFVQGRFKGPNGQQRFCHPRSLAIPRRPGQRPNGASRHLRK